MSELDHISEVQLLFVKHYSSVKAYIHSLVRDSHAVDDIVQNVFLIVTSKAETFTLGTNFIAWVFTIARFEVLRYFEKSKRNRLKFSNDLLEQMLVDAPEDLAGHPRRIALGVCLESLSPKIKEMMRLRYEEGQKPKKIAEELGWTPESVSVAMSRSRKKLRHCIERRMAKEG